MKKKSIKKIQSFLIITLAVVLSIPNLVYAESQNHITQEDKINFLKSIGTTDEAISNYNPIQIDNLYSTLYGKDANFSGFESQIVEIQEENTTLRGNIPTSQLKLSVATYDVISNGVVSEVDVSLGFNWLQAPFFNLTDGFTFTWDDDVFYDEGFYATSGVNTNKGYRLIDSINAPATASAGGMGWYLSINNPIDANTIGGHYGGAQILLKPRMSFTAGKTLNSKMYFTYAHQLIGFSITFGPGSTGVSITGGNYDQQTFSYTYH